MARLLATLMVLCLLHAGAVSAARITAQGGTSYLGGANPTIVVSSSNAAPAAGAPAAAAMAAAMASHSEAMDQFQRDMGDSAPLTATAQQPAAAAPGPVPSAPAVLRAPAVAPAAAPKPAAASTAVPTPVAPAAPSAALPTFAPVPSVPAADGQMMTPPSHAEAMAQFRADMGYPSDLALASGVAAYRAARAAGATPEAAMAAARSQQVQTQQQLLVASAAAAQDDLPAPAAPSSEMTHEQAMAAHAQSMSLYNRQMAKLEAGLGIKVDRAPVAAAAGTAAAAPATRPRSVLAAEADEAGEGYYPSADDNEAQEPAAEAVRTTVGRRMLAERSTKAANARIVAPGSRSQGAVVTRGGTLIGYDDDSVTYLGGSTREWVYVDGRWLYRIGGAP